MPKRVTKAELLEFVRQLAHEPMDDDICKGAEDGDSDHAGCSWDDGDHDNRKMGYRHEMSIDGAFAVADHYIGEARSMLGIADRFQ